MSDNFRDQIELLQDLVEVEEERAAAYETREEDRERWRAAKAAYAEKRSFWRAIKELTAAPSDDPSTVHVEATETKKTKIHNEEK